MSCFCVGEHTASLVPEKTYSLTKNYFQCCECVAKFSLCQVIGHVIYADKYELVQRWLIKHVTRGLIADLYSGFRSIGSLGRKQI